MKVPLFKATNCPIIFYTTLAKLLTPRLTAKFFLLLRLTDNFFQITAKIISEVSQFISQREDTLFSLALII